jgi:SAM-dependent methyltransferase
MRERQSLDNLVAKKAVEFADQIKAVAAIADKEEEIRIETERQLAFIEKEAGVKLEGKHEFTVYSGRIDSVYDRVIIEYKNPSSPADRIGPRANSPGTKRVVEQIKRRFYDMRSQFGQPLNTLFGVGVDGKHFVFVRFRDDRWQVQEPVEVNRYSAERFLHALFNLAQSGKPFAPEYLAGDFSSEAKLAQDGIHTLYEAIVNTSDPKARIFFSQWKLLFGEVCGYDVENPSDKIKKLATFYHVPLRELKPAELLFAVHSYYAIFMKLLASEIVAFFRDIPTPLQRMVQAPTSAKLKKEMKDLEAGSIFPNLNITNFLEGDLFTWYTSVWSDPVEELVRAMVGKLDEYYPGTLAEDPAGSRDLLKKLYQQLFPKTVRHDLGEYYTPDWLADHVLDELGYVGDPDKRLLDPACGSGTFLAMAIARIRRWYDQNRERCAFGEDDLCRKIQANVVGFDLNPLAVMAARTNYLIAVRNLIRYVDKVEIPVYLCDSISTPSEYGSQQQKEMFGKPMELRTSAKPTPFLVPNEVVGDAGTLALYARVLEACAPARSGYSVDEFIERCREIGIVVSEPHDHQQLFNDLRQLDKEGKNSIWARIIKNAFAPLFAGRFDFVAGNPPWVNWDNLPQTYRNETKPLWIRNGLFNLTGTAGRLGGGKKDISMLFVYESVRHYLNLDGRLAFVITQSLFKTEGAADGFRNFALPPSGRAPAEPFRVAAVHDMSALKVFEDAANRTAVMVVHRGGKTTHPVEYTYWVAKKSARIPQEYQLDHVLTAVNRLSLGAVPVYRGKANAPWLTVCKPVLDELLKAVGVAEYSAQAGATTCGADGVFLIHALGTRSGNNILVVSAIYNRTYASAVRTGVHEKSSGYQPE